MSFTPPPAAPSASAPIPSRSLDDQITFDLKTDTYLNWLATFRNWLATFVDWIGTFTSELTTTQDQVQTSALAATDASAAALAASSFKGLWASLAGPLAKPACVKHNGVFWMLLNDLADVSNSIPGVSVDWTAIDMVSGPASAVDGHLAVFDGTTGKLVKTAGVSAESLQPITMASGSVSGVPTISDNGKHLVRSASFTLPAADVFPAGGNFLVDNSSAAAITLTAPAGMTMRLVNGTSKASVSLAAYGTAVVYYKTASECVIGGGVS